MKRKNKGPVGVFVSILVAGSLVTGYQVGQADTNSGVSRFKRTGGEYLAERLILRHCEPQEDTLATLKMVAYEPGQGFIVYRCVRP